MKLARKPSAEAPKASPAKTPKQKNKKKTLHTPKKGDGDILELGACQADSEAGLDAGKVAKAIQALRKVKKEEEAKKTEAKAKKTTTKKKLFSGEGERVSMQVTGIKLPRDGRNHVLKMVLPHSFLPDPSDVCLFVKDDVKGIKADHEPVVLKFQALLEEKGVPKSMVSEVISLRQLKVEYKQFEAKAKLANRFDKFLADDRIVRLLPKFLGKAFYKKKRFPTQVNLQAQDLKAEISKALRTSHLPLNHHGTCSMVPLGNTDMSDARLAENVAAASRTLSARYPGGWKNLRSLHVKAETSLSIPLHVSTTSANDVGYVDADIPSKIKREAVTGELSTQPGMEVTVLPGGGIKIRKTKDPEWDDEKDEPFVSGSEEEDDGEGEDKEEEEKKESKEKAKKRKGEEKEKAAKKKKKKVAEDSDEDSEDEAMEAAEMKYLKGREGDEDDEVEEDDDEEEDGEEEEESEYDDDQDLDDDDVVVDADEDDSDEEEEDDDDDKLILKCKGDEDYDDDESE